jgi:hypothetical protein
MSKVEKVWSPDGGVIEKKTSLADGEAFSFFDDDEGESLYSGVVLLDGFKVRVRELTAAEMAQYTQSERQLSELLGELASTTDGAIAENIAEQMKSAQRAIWDTTIGLAVSGWELQRPDGTAVPCTPESKARLRASKKSELCDKIVQRSSMGRDLSGFLATS